MLKNLMIFAKALKYYSKIIFLRYFAKNTKNQENQLYFKNFQKFYYYRL